MIRDLVRQHFEAAATDFAQDPSALNWRILTRAMWAHQGTHGLSPANERLIDHEIIDGMAHRQRGEPYSINEEQSNDEP